MAFWCRKVLTEGGRTEECRRHLRRIAWNQTKKEQKCYPEKDDNLEWVGGSKLNIEKTDVFGDMGERPGCLEKGYI